MIAAQLIDPQPPATYRTGAAARLAGIPVATLRVWERRYEIVAPRAGASTHRRYSVEDVRRLGLIKGLVDLGHPIGSIANLPMATLIALRADGAASGSHAGNAALPGTSSVLRPIRVAIVGTALAAEAAQGLCGALALNVAVACADPAQAGQALQGVSAELLAIELPALRDEAVAQVDGLAALVGAELAIVAYRFGTEAAVRALRSRGHVVVRAPLDLSEVASLGGALLPGREGPPAGPLPGVPVPRFDEMTLAELARIATPMYCECPRHVVELLQSIGAFERYSAECENRGLADAELHRYLHRVAGTARAFFEEALVRLARAEGFPLPDSNAHAESRHA